ncbi:MAG: HD domain-containing protein [Gemmatimonadetes bacterium]|nr:HD domain-containing protein [Gemmatimonadota bacterium]
MTTPDQPARAPRQSIADSMASTDRILRQAGRDFVISLYATLRSLKLYPLENAQVQKSLDELTGLASALLQIEDELEIRLSSDFIFVNETRLRLGLDNYASFSHVLGTLRNCGMGVVKVNAKIERREWQVFVSLLLSFASRAADPNKLSELQQKLVSGGALNLMVEGEAEGDDDSDNEGKSKEVAKRTYERSVSVTKDLINSVRMGRAASVKKVKRAVQGIVDQVLANEVSIVGLTTIRDYDEYTFTHSVNVCIFSVAMGRRLGLSKVQLYDLGMAALFHDVGKSRVPLEVLSKDGPLNEEEWRIMQAHPWLGVLTLFGLRGYGEVPYRGIVAAYEHHMKIDLTGYPKSLRPRRLSVYSKIVACADAFDAATTRRVYQTTPIQPDQVLREIWENPRRGHDRVIVKALINLLGIYPVGTCVILDTYEVGIVQAANPDPVHLHRPMVKIVATPDGGSTMTGPVVNLAEAKPEGDFLRTIIKVTDPAKYGIRASDHFV